MATYDQVTAETTHDGGTVAYHPTAAPIGAESATTETTDAAIAYHPTAAPTGAESATTETTDAAIAYHPTAAPTGAEIRTPTEGNGIVIPTGDFRSVDVTLVDQNGDPLDGAEWVMSGSVFPTAARVEQEDGETTARLWLLNVAYDEFQVLARSERAGVDYVWYEPPDNNGEALIGADQNEATLVFETRRIAGLFAGTGTDFGGMLG